MRTQKCHSWNWALIPGALCIALMVAFLAFGQEQPPQQNLPAPVRAAGQPRAGGPALPAIPDPRMRGPVGPGMMPGNPEMRQEGLIAELFRPEVQKELAITAEQRQKLDDIRFNTQKDAIQHRAALQIHRLELSRMISSENPDRAAIDKKIQDVAQEEASLMRSSINARLNARGVLTAEQRAKLAQFMQNRARAERPRVEGVMPPAQPAPKAGPAREKPSLPTAPAKPQPE